MTEEDTPKITETDLRKLFSGDVDWLGSSEDREKYLLQILVAVKTLPTLQKLYASADGDRTVLIHECEKLRLDIENLKKAIQIRDRLLSENYKQ